MPKISNIYQDKKSQKWYFVANLGSDELGNRIRYWGRGFPSQKEAKNAFDEYMNNYSQTSVKMNSTMHYLEFYETYFEPDYKRSVSSRTFENRSSSMRLHFSYFHKTQLKEISAMMLKRWQNKLAEKYSNAYIRNVFGMFQRSLDLAVKLGLLQSNIAKNVGNVKKLKQSSLEFWTKEEFCKVLGTFDTSNYYEHYYFIVIWLLFMTGLRIGEAQALEWKKDINWEDKTLNISKSMYYKNSEEFYIKEPKTKASNRIIALDEDTINRLKNWHQEQSKNIMSSRWILSYNGFPAGKHSIRKYIIKHAQKANVNPIKIHALRHSHASLLIALGENALIVRDRLGHEDIETTLGTYGHLYPNTNKAVAEKLNNLITIVEKV